MSAFPKPISLLVISSIGTGNTTFVHRLAVNDAGAVVGWYPEPQPTKEELAQSKATGLLINFGRFTIDGNWEDGNWIWLFGVYAVGDPYETIVRRMFILGIKVSGLMLLVDSTKPETFRRDKQYVDVLLSAMEVPVTIVANKQDLAGALPIRDIGAILRLSIDEPIMPCIATDESSVRDVINAMLNRINQNV